MFKEIVLDIPFPLFSCLPLPLSLIVSLVCAPLSNLLRLSLTLLSRDLLAELQALLFNVAILYFRAYAGYDLVRHPISLHDYAASVPSVIQSFVSCSFGLLGLASPFEKEGVAAGDLLIIVGCIASITTSIFTLWTGYSAVRKSEMLLLRILPCLFSLFLFHFLFHFYFYFYFFQCAVLGWLLGKCVFK